MELTVIAILDKMIGLVASICLAYVFMVAMARISKMFKEHQYAQLIVTGLFFVICFLFLSFPGEVKNVLSGFNFVFEKLK